MKNPSDLNKPQIFSPIDETELDLCRVLWQSVALQTVIDARSKSQKPEMQEIRESALDWLRADSEYAADFEMVCEFAGLDPDKSRELFQDLAAYKREGVDFRCMKKEAPQNRGQEDRTRYLKRIRYQKSLKVKAELELEMVD